jgi:hypothetical protein
MPEERNRKTSTGQDGSQVSRRTFLGGALAGTALAGAGALSACAPMPAGGTAQPVEAPLVGRGPRRKVSKSFARYQDRPNRGQRCADCRHFLPSGACRIVAGPISSNGWSRYFEPA